MLLLTFTVDDAIGGGGSGTGNSRCLGAEEEDLEASPVAVGGNMVIFSFSCDHLAQWLARRRYLVETAAPSAGGDGDARRWWRRRLSTLVEEVEGRREPPPPPLARVASRHGVYTVTD